MYRLARLSLVLAAFSLSACAADAAGKNDSAGEITITEFNAPVAQPSGYFGYGQDASVEEIAGWDIDIRPDGMGLPPGGATAEDGEMLYEDQCALCHGSFGEGVGRYPVLAGGEGTLSEDRPEKTIGSYWPYASTVWDYIHRAMPFMQPESLSDQEVYALTAYVLYLNDLVEYDFKLTQDNLALIEMPNKDGFFLDDRPDTSNEACRRNCTGPARIRNRAAPAAREEVESDVVEASGAEAASGQSMYEQACALCHARGVGDAPIPGDASTWAARIDAGREALIANALAGKGQMPPKGGQIQLSDEDVIAAVDYMLEVTAN